MDPTNLALVNLFEEAFHDIFNPDASELTEATFTTPEGIDYRTRSLFLLDSRLEAVQSLLEMLLRILLGRPPFAEPPAESLQHHRASLAGIWGIGVGPGSTSSTLDIPPISADLGLDVLSNLRKEFQKLEVAELGFVVELLLSCLQRLCPKGLGHQFWAVAHEKAVNVLSELFQSFPHAAQPPGPDPYEQVAADNVWRCLMLLTSGAGWWAEKSDQYKQSLEKLARHFCLLRSP